MTKREWQLHSESAMLQALTKKWTEEQDVMAGKLDLTDSVNLSEVSYIGAVDISFFPSGNCGIAALAVARDGVIVYDNYEDVSFSTPYVSGFLGFREVPCYISLLEKLKVQHPDIYPEILLVDGNGILHHRLVGSATHLGIKLNICTIGIAKNLLSVDGMEWKEMKDKVRQEVKKNPVPLIGNSGRQYGWAYCPPGGAKPIFVSPGHKISLDGALAVLQKFGPPHRIPQVLRHVDLTSRDIIRKALETRERRMQAIRLYVFVGLLTGSILWYKWLSKR